MEFSSSTHFFRPLLFLFAGISLTNLAAASAPVTGKSSTEFIRTSCSTTTYPKLCFSSLSAHASVIQTSPMLLAHTALSVTLETTKSTSDMMNSLSLGHGLSPREAAAMKDCVEEVSDSVYQLRQSLAEMNQLRGPNFGLTMNDIQTWVSAALTDDTTCTDGFAGTAVNGNLKNVVRLKILKIAHLTSNALALINSYASVRG